MPPTGLHASVDLDWLRAADVDDQRNIKSIAAEADRRRYAAKKATSAVGAE